MVTLLCPEQYKQNVVCYTRPTIIRPVFLEHTVNADFTPSA
jgi:hypothetical protein